MILAYVLCDAKAASKASQRSGAVEKVGGRSEKRGEGRDGESIRGRAIKVGQTVTERKTGG